MKTVKAILILSLLFAMATGLTAQGTAKIANTTLWKISGNNLTGDSYLLLSTPTCDAKVNFPDKVIRVLDQVQNIAIEENVNSKSNAEKVQKLILAKADSQRIKSVLTASELDQIIKQAKESNILGAETNDLQLKQFLNQYKCLYIQSLLAALSNPCGSTKAERPEKTLEDYAKKNGKSFGELFSPEEIFAEYDVYDKEYWRQNILFLAKNTDLVKTSGQVKNTFYASENLNALSLLYNNNNYFKVKYTEAHLRQHNDQLLTKIDQAVKRQSSLVVVSTTNFLASNHSLYSLLTKSGYTLTPILN